MPIYEYRCKECEEQFEVLQSIGADSKDLKCPACGKTSPDRVMSTFTSSAGGRSTSSSSCSPGGGFT